jgi:hypothetical protein
MTIGTGSVNQTTIRWRPRRSSCIRYILFSLTFKDIFFLEFRNISLVICYVMMNLYFMFSQMTSPPEYFDTSGKFSHLFLSSSCVMCDQCCKCLWNLHSWLPLWFSPMSILNERKLPNCEQCFQTNKQTNNKAKKKKNHFSIGFPSRSANTSAYCISSCLNSLASSSVKCSLPRRYILVIYWGNCFSFDIRWAYAIQIQNTKQQVLF